MNWEARNFDNDQYVVLGPRDEQNRRELIATCTGDNAKANAELINKMRNRYDWQPISEMHEDNGDVILVNVLEDCGHMEIGSNLNLDWDESKWTHFARISPIGQEEYERMKAEALAASHPERSLSELGRDDDAPRRDMEWDIYQRADAEDSDAG